MCAAPAGKVRDIAQLQHQLLELGQDKDEGQRQASRQLQQLQAETDRCVWHLLVRMAPPGAQGMGGQ